MENRQSKDFRYVYANGFALQFGDNDATIKFGVKENLAAQDNAMFEEVGVIMTPKSIKMLNAVLTRAIEHHERLRGPIAVPMEKLAEMDSFFQSTPGQAQP